MELHADDYLPEHALGLLAGPVKARVESHLTTCARCAARFAELASSVTLPPDAARAAASYPIARLRLSPTPLPMPPDSPDRFHRFIDEVAAFFDIRPGKAQALLELLDDPSCWSPGPAPGTQVFAVEAGPKYLAADACILRGEPGARVPHHVHVGPEHLFVLQGAFQDDAGVDAKVGSRVTKPKGSGHEVTVVGQVPCICCVLNEDALDQDDETNPLGLEHRHFGAQSSAGPRSAATNRRMPLASPAGPLTTLDEIVADARAGTTRLEDRFPMPVFLVVAPAEGWSQITAVKSDAKPGASVSMLPTIVVNVAHKKYSESQPRLSVGRAEVCDVVLPFSALSKVHLWMQIEGDGWTVTDAGSRNGTVVDGIRLIPNQGVRLRDGGTLRFGDVTAKFFHPSSFWADLRRRLER